jgi:pimeloyl-ACP methyl ester carboxylesterase
MLGCATQDHGDLSLPLDTLESIEADIFSLRTTHRTLSERGPFSASEPRELSIPLGSSEQIAVSIVFSGHGERAPLVILQHGNLATSAVHIEQARHLASWGFHVIAPSLENSGAWLENGSRILRLTRFLQTWTDILESRYDPDRIILAGHSFGGSAVSLAASKGAKVAGVLLLDPALYHPTVQASMSQIDVPVAIVGADERVFRSKHRDVFFRSIRRAIEWSISGATHNDAQLPTDAQRGYFGDWSVDKQKQKEFLAAMVYTCYGLAYGNGLVGITKQVKIGQAERIYLDLKTKSSND